MGPLISFNQGESSNSGSKIVWGQQVLTFAFRFDCLISLFSQLNQLILRDESIKLNYIGVTEIPGGHADSCITSFIITSESKSKFVLYSF